MKLGLKYIDVKGVFVGGCVERGEGSSFRAKAHAHNNRKSKNFGWICVRSKKRIGEYVMNIDNGFDGVVTKPSRLLLHEVAHIHAPNHSHDDVWRRRMRDLGQPIPSRYRKQRRARQSELTSSSQKS